MAKFLADEDLPRAIVRGARRGSRELDIVRVQDVGLSGKGDPDILEWAAQEQRIVVSRDKSTMPDHAARRMQEGLPVAGLLLVGRRWRSQLRDLIDDLLLIAEDDASDWSNRIEYLPL